MLLVIVYSSQIGCRGNFCAIPFTQENYINACKNYVKPPLHILNMKSAHESVNYINSKRSNECYMNMSYEKQDEKQERFPFDMHVLLIEIFNQL